MTKNISDYLRDFPTRASVFTDQERKSVFFLTLNVILNLQKKKRKPLAEIKKTQDKIKDVLGVEGNDDPYKKGLFIYPEKTLHFSILSFYEYTPTTKFKKNEDFNSLQNKIRTNKDYQSLRERVGSFLSKTISNQHKNYKADIRWLFTGVKPEYRQNGFSLQVYPEKSFLEVVDKLLKETKKLFLDENQLNFKGYPSEESFFRFVLNTGRFINYDKKITNKISAKALNYTEKFNRLNDNELKINFKIDKLTLVESDPWLYNAKKGNEYLIKEFPL